MFFPLILMIRNPVASSPMERKDILRISTKMATLKFVWTMVHRHGYTTTTDQPRFCDAPVWNPLCKNLVALTLTHSIGRCKPPKHNLTIFISHSEFISFLCHLSHVHLTNSACVPPPPLRSDVACKNGLLLPPPLLPHPLLCMRPLSLTTNTLSAFRVA